jgi:hypothetical protein
MIWTASHSQAVICAGDRCEALQILLGRWKLSRQKKDAPHQVEVILGNQHPVLIAKPAFRYAAESTPYINFPWDFLP